jgi:hypothetical protein
MLIRNGAEPQRDRVAPVGRRGRFYDTVTTSTVRVLFSRSRDIVHFNDDGGDVVILR